MSAKKVEVQSQIIVKFPYTEQRSRWIGVTSVLCGYMSTSVHKRRNSSGTENSSAVHRTTLLLHPFNGPFSGTTWVSRYQKGKPIWILLKQKDSEWQWHQLDHMQVCTSLQADNLASTSPLSVLQAGCPSCRPTNSVKAHYYSNKKPF